MPTHTHIIDLTKLVKPPLTDSISGRDEGEVFARDERVLEHVAQGEHIILRIDEQFVRAINGSFILGFFNKVFERLHSKRLVKEQFEIEGVEFYQRLFEKNWDILDSIYAPAE